MTRKFHLFAPTMLAAVVTLNAGHFTPVDAGLIPTGEIRAVDGTPFDFRKPTAIGARIGQDDERQKLGKGYDHNWVLNPVGSELALTARVEETESGRALEVRTTSQERSSTREIIWTARLEARAAKCTAAIQGLASKRNITPIRPTVLSSLLLS